MSSKNRITIKFRIGKNSGSGDATGTGVAEKITNAVAAETASLAEGRALVGIRGLNTRLQRTIETEYTNGVRHAANNMMGQISNGITPKVFSFSDVGFNSQIVSRTKAFKAATQPFSRGQVSWQPLHRNTIRSKIADGLNPDRAKRYYRHTGALRSQLLNMARQMVKRTGVVRITFDKTGRFVPTKSRSTVIPIGKLRITLLPSISRSSLPGLVSGDLGQHDRGMSFERALGLSNEAIEKLQGPFVRGFHLVHRPLLQPVFTYWSLFRIPARIAQALEQSITSTARTDGGYSEFSEVR